MSDKIDMSLDDIIKKDGIKINSRKRGSGLQFRSRPTFRRSFGGRFGNKSDRSGGYGSARRQSARPQPYFRSQNNNNNNNTFQSGIGGRLVISNLAYSVSDEDLNELFASFGPLKKCCIHYNQFGYSLGIAEIIFEMKDDAITAYDKYNGVPLDGRSMRIQLIGGKPQNSRPFDGSRSRGRGRGFGNRSQTKVTVEDLDKELDSWKMEVE